MNFNFRYLIFTTTKQCMRSKLLREYFIISLFIYSFVLTSTDKRWKIKPRQSARARYRIAKLQYAPTDIEEEAQPAAPHFTFRVFHRPSPFTLTLILGVGNCQTSLIWIHLSSTLTHWPPSRIILQARTEESSYGCFRVVLHVN